jgi:hypothetical protein
MAESVESAAADAGAGHAVEEEYGGRGGRWGAVCCEADGAGGREGVNVEFVGVKVEFGRVGWDLWCTIWGGERPHADGLRAAVEMKRLGVGGRYRW